MSLKRSQICHHCNSKGSKSSKSLFLKCLNNFQCSHFCTILRPSDHSATCPGFNSRCSQKNYFNIAEINRLPRFEESGRRLENVDRTQKASATQVPQKKDFLERKANYARLSSSTPGHKPTSFPRPVIVIECKFFVLCSQANIICDAYYVVNFTAILQTK